MAFFETKKGSYSYFLVDFFSNFKKLRLGEKKTNLVFAFVLKIKKVEILETFFGKFKNGRKAVLSPFNSAWILLL